jgi:hypothetical protein
MVTNGMPDISAYSVSTGHVTAYRGTHVRLEELEKRVQTAVQQ